MSNGMFGADKVYKEIHIQQDICLYFHMNKIRLVRGETHHTYFVTKSGR